MDGFQQGVGTMANKAFKSLGGNDGKSNYYKIGEKMRAQILTSAEGEEDATFPRTGMFGQNWPFPKPDSFGNCDNFKSVYFMQDDESSCNQMASLRDNCDNLLNPEFYANKLKVMIGRKAALGDAKNPKVEIGEVWNLDPATSKYTKVSTQPGAPSKSTSG